MSKSINYSSGPGPVPPRWLNCPRKSLGFIADKFVAFKTPLSEKFDEQVPQENKFTPSMLLYSMKSYKKKIGLWIDLTNTTRFYDKAEIEREGVRYLKLHCRGHGQCPSEEQVTTFVEVCDKFIRKNPLEIIAVHCTHGFNRTGFMIASYLVLKEDCSCDLAVKAFASLRPPGIYKQDYLQELFSRLDDPDAIPDSPPLPDWCFGQDSDNTNDEGDEADNMHSNSEPYQRRGFMRKRFNWNKSIPTFIEGVAGIRALGVDEPKFKSVQKKIQDICGWRGSGFPGCQPVSMTRENLKFLMEKGYKVSWKADGTRYMMLIDGKNEVYFADRDCNIFHSGDIDFREKHDLRKHLCDTLIDGEMVIDVDPKAKQKFPKYLIYDAVRIHGRDIMNDNFHMRFERINTDIISPRQAAIEKGLINKSKETFGVRRKDFWDANVQNTAKLLSETFKTQLWHEPDGLIFQPEPEPYIAGRCDTVLKWKPLSHNSVDFRVKIVTVRGEGILPTSTAELYVGGLDTPFASMKATKKLKEFNGKIIECKLENNKWVFMRERTDKSFPNSYTTAVGVCTSILNPVSEEMLLELLEKHCYKRPDQELMPPPSKMRKI